MRRCKLEYMIRNIPLIPRKRLINLFDVESQFHFDEFYIKELENFKNMEVITGDSAEALMYECIKEINEERQKKYEQIFSEINEICINNKTYPIFNAPSNIEECLKIRKEILHMYKEEEVNAFFNVESIRDYTPPIYEIEKLSSVYNFIIFLNLYGIFVKRFLFFNVFLFYNKKGEAIVCKNYFKKKKRIYYLFVFWN